MNKLLKQAFTLIELLVVIAIIGILSGMIVIGMSGVTEKANIAKSQVFSNSLRNALMLNLISEWKFDGAVIDSWGDNDGTILGAPVYKSSSECVSGQCLSFDGSDDSISIVSRTYNLSTGTTFSFWSKKNIEHNGTILGSSVASSYMRIMFLTGSTLYFETNTDGDYCSGSPTHDTNWHYYVITTSGTIAKFYEDSVIITSNNSIIDSGITLDMIADSYHFNGLLDELRIFDAVMPISQIQEQYYLGLNELLANGGITEKEYLSRLNNYASNN